MPFVLDASVTACWAYSDETDIRADIALSLLEETSARVPILWWFEIRHVLLTGERRKRVSEAETLRFFQRLAESSIHFDDLPDGALVMALARRRRLSFYDASYLELALRTGLALATLDGQLAAAARVEGVPLVGD